MGCESATTISSVIQDTLVLMKKPAIVCFCLTIRLVLKIRLQNGDQFRASDMFTKKNGCTHCLDVFPEPCKDLPSRKQADPGDFPVPV